MRRFALPSLFFASLSLLAAQSASAGLRPLLPGEQTVYQTVQSGPDVGTTPGNTYRTFYTQITGNAFVNYGDEIILAPGTNRFITNISVATQTFRNQATPGYMDGVDSQGPNPPGYEDFGGFLELTMYLNDGPPDVSGDPFVDAAPHNTPTSRTVIARSRIPTPTYPTGGTSRDSNGFNDPSDPTDNVNDPWIVNFPFPAVLVPDRFTFSVVNLNKLGQSDGYNFDANQFGLWHSTLSTTNTDPDANFATHNNNTTYNTNHVGQSRTGLGPYTLTYSGQWTWIEYNGPRHPNNSNGWESDRDLNSGPEATIYAQAVVPEPSSIVLCAFGLAGLVALRLRRRGR